MVQEGGTMTNPGCWCKECGKYMDAATFSTYNALCFNCKHRKEQLKMRMSTVKIKFLELEAKVKELKAMLDSISGSQELLDLYPKCPTCEKSLS